MANFTAVDLFAGAGGLSLGLRDAGIDTKFAVEFASDAASTYALHSPEVELCCGDVKDVDFRKWQGIDLVAGGPPCQPFSTGGLRRGSSDQRDLIPQFVRAVLEIRPRAFIMENVPGLISFSEYLKESFSPLFGAYKICAPQVVNAADFGVPQSRRRLILVGSLDRFDFELGNFGDRRVAAGEVITLEPLGQPNRSKVTYAKRPDLRPNPYQGHLFNGGGRAIELDKPSPTILAAAGGNKTHFIDIDNLVPSYHRHLLSGGEPLEGELPGARRLTVAESAALQTFPPTLVFAGSRSSQYTQIGNAVPPRLAEAIGAQLCEKLMHSRSQRMAA